MTELTYEPATPADIESLYALSKDLIDRYEDTAAIDYPKVMAWVRRKIETNIRSYTRILFRGEHAGYFRLAPDGAEAALDDLYLFPAYQRLGIGTAVIGKCCADANGPVTLYVFTRNTGALALYRRLGFRTLRQASATRLILRKEPSNENHKTNLF